jgi:hypothetical protein
VPLGAGPLSQQASSWPPTKGNRPRRLDLPLLARSTRAAEPVLFIGLPYGQFDLPRTAADIETLPAVWFENRESTASAAAVQTSNPGHRAIFSFQFSCCFNFLRA